MEKRFLIGLFILALVLILVVPITLYFYKERKIRELAINICIEACRQEMISGRDLTNGPCLLDPIKELPNWVCDVVHNPRQYVDDLKENQCSEYLKGKAKRFVEVSINCQFIRTN